MLVVLTRGGPSFFYDVITYKHTNTCTPCTQNLAKTFLHYYPYNIMSSLIIAEEEGRTRKEINRKRAVDTCTDKRRKIQGS